MKVRRLQVGGLGTNCYLAWDEESAPGEDGLRPCLIVDPGAEARTIIAELEKQKLRPELIVATHCHGDHIGALDGLLEAYPETPFAVGEAEREWPGDPVRNLSYGFGLPARFSAPTRLLKGGEELKTAGLKFQVLAVPGHSPGSVALYCESGKAVFTGDALFAHNVGIGRTDLPGGDTQQLFASIREKLFPLPDDTIVWPGHANRCRIGVERKSNIEVGEDAPGW